MPSASVAGFCNLLGRSRLLSADEVRDLLRRWQAESGPSAGDAEAFIRWLVSNRYLTAYQADTLRRGHADRFFLGEYKLLDRIGQGRMAGVYRAMHRLGQTVAIKVLPPSKARDPQAFGRFQREARLALKLDHPNVVRTLESGEEHGLHFIVMEHLDGETLDEVLKRRGKLPPDRAAALLHQALLGLMHLHEQGLVHRDLKPANLMLTSDGVLKILDVGLGRALFDEGDPASGGPIDLTAQGDVLGDPDYMAPEQARDAHNADIRSDIYSLGCILYHLLSGQPPFADSNAVRKIVRHATEAPRPLKAFGVEVPASLEMVLERMLAKDAALRHATPDQAAQALRPFMSGPVVPIAMPVASAPVAPPPAPPPAVATPATPRSVRRKESSPATVRREGKQIGRREVLFLFLGIGGAALAVVIGLLLHRWFSSRLER
jgi:serine/threonine protein kinase